MADDARLSGRCLCGEVTFTFTPAEREADACHCSMCRRWSAGPAFSVRAGGTPEVSGTQHVAVFKSSDWGERHFCRKCGSNLFWSAPSAGYFGVSAGTLDQTDDLAFRTEIFVDQQPALYTFANPTERLTEAEFLARFSDCPEAEDNNA